MLDAYGLRLDAWHGSGPKIKRDRVITRLPIGYGDGERAAVATQAADIITAWAKMLTNHPLSSVGERAAELAASVGSLTYDDPDADGEGLKPPTRAS